MPLKHLLFAAVLVALPVATLAQASITDPVVARVEADGYTVIDIRRTLLGRVLIEAENAQSQREIVLNRTTGEVLRDRVYPKRTASPPGEARPAPGARGGGAPGARGGTGGSAGGGGASGGGSGAGSGGGSGGGGGGGAGAAGGL